MLHSCKLPTHWAPPTGAYSHLADCVVLSGQVKVTVVLTVKAPSGDSVTTTVELAPPTDGAVPQI